MASDLCKLPFSDFVYAEHEQAKVKYDSFADDDEFPVIDFGASDASSQLANAARCYGFFQLVNHGVNPETVHEMQSQVKALFALPMERKLVVKHPENSRVGYGLAGYHPRTFWHDGFEVFDSPPLIQELSNKLWPPPFSTSAVNFSEAAKTFTGAMAVLGFKLMEQLAIQLGAPPDAFTRHCSCEEMTLRFNHYPPCPDPSLTLGMPPHYDKHVLTLLHQDTVGGLQIFRNGRWMGLRPRTDSIIVNIGSSLQVMSNGEYISMQHRVVTNGDTSRLSMGYFMSPRPETLLQPCPEIIDSEHPPKYSSLTFKELKKQIDKAREVAIDKGYLDEFEIRRN